MTIGDWQRVKMLDRLSEVPYLTEIEENMLFEAAKRDYPGRGEPNLSQFQMEQIELWEQASTQERLLGFGISVLMRPMYGAGNPEEDVFFFRMAVEALAFLNEPDTRQIEKEVKASIAKRNANLRHDKPGGARAKRAKIIEIWASGKYSTRDICAEQECAALNMSFSTARKSLRGVPDPVLAAARRG